MNNISLIKLLSETYSGHKDILDIMGVFLGTIGHYRHDWVNPFILRATTSSENYSNISYKLK